MIVMQIAHERSGSVLGNMRLNVYSKVHVYKDIKQKECRRSIPRTQKHKQQGSFKNQTETSYHFQSPEAFSITLSPCTQKLYSFSLYSYSIEASKTVCGSFLYPPPPYCYFLTSLILVSLSLSKYSFGAHE